MYACRYISGVNVCMYVGTPRGVCMYVCMHACMYVCMYAHICVHLYIEICNITSVTYVDTSHIRIYVGKNRHPHII